MEIEYRVRDMGPLNVELYIEESLKHWNKANEDTSSLIPLLYSGHYKYSAKLNKISEIYTILGHIGARCGFFLSRWLKLLQEILLKEPGNLNPENFRSVFQIGL